MSIKKHVCSVFIAAALISLTACGGGSSSEVRTVTTTATVTSPVVDTGQSKTFDATKEITAPAVGQAFYGQDAQVTGTHQPSYTISADGLTVKDNVNGLTWQRGPDTNEDGVINVSDKLTLAQAQTRVSVLNAAKFGGYSDWRLPTIKELYSLMNFSGQDTSPFAGTDTSSLKPFIDKTYFHFGYGDSSAGERIIDAQYASSNLYVGDTTMMFGVNFADGRIKGYGLTLFGSDKAFYVQYVRGSAYGVNDLVDNGDSTITDKATGLMWTKGDSGAGMDWEAALAWAQTKNAEKYLGHSDWRLPNAKELQGIVDYARSPDSTSSAAISALFTSTSITNEAGQTDYPYYWSSTTHEGLDVASGATSTANGGWAVYIAFGRAMGYMTDPTGANGSWIDVHGAGAQRSDPKKGGATDFPTGHGPQGDAIRGDNYVRLVRDATP